MAPLRTVRPLALLLLVLLLAVPAALPAAGAGRRGAVPVPAAPEDATGYRHLGATTDDGYAGVTGALTVTDPGVRHGTDDFVAVRFMALGAAGGKAKWLEAGWTEDGWRDNAQHLYTYDTDHMDWSYYDQYPIRAGDTVHLALESGGAASGGTVWRALLWWDDRWNQLVSVTLPIGSTARIEQYVEVYADPSRGGDIRLPRTDVGDVQVETAAGGPFTAWRDPAVPTSESAPYTGYCVSWLTRHDTWYAASC
jgi:hypothetical protein